MKISILNGAPEQGNLDTYLDKLTARLKKSGHDVTTLVVREMNLRPCTGCFKCWVKTPGHCILKDESDRLDRATINADFVLWASPLVMGFPSAIFKTAMDKHLPLIHPYMEVVQGEIHHVARYPRYPRLGLLLEKTPGSDEEDVHIVSAIFARTALNFKSRLEFAETTSTPVETLAAMIEQERSEVNLLQPTPLPTTFSSIQPPHSMTIFNGSPRGANGSNTLIMLEEVRKGFGKPAQVYPLQRLKDTEAHVRAFAEAECVWLGFPLYTDSMPGTVKHFIEALQPLVARGKNPPIGFLVQSGFIESAHSRSVERYLQKLATRLGSPYLGTIVKGGAEGLHVMPPQANRKLFARLQALGAGLANEGHLDEKILRQIASPEHIPAALVPLVSIGLRFSAAGFYFNNMMKKNGVYERRFEQPFLER